MPRCALRTAISRFARRRRRFNAEAQRFAEIRREFFFSAFLCVSALSPVWSWLRLGRAVSLRLNGPPERNRRSRKNLAPRGPRISDFLRVSGFGFPAPPGCAHEPQAGPLTPALSPSEGERGSDRQISGELRFRGRENRRPAVGEDGVHHRGGSRAVAFPFTFHVSRFNSHAPQRGISGSCIGERGQSC